MEVYEVHLKLSNLSRMYRPSRSGERGSTNNLSIILVFLHVNLRRILKTLLWKRGGWMGGDCAFKRSKVGSL